jgi:glycine cleavage system H lipoate-binding protein
MAEYKEKEVLRVVPPGKNKCIWMDAGIVSYRLCIYNFDCPSCEFDHAMQLKLSRQSEAQKLAPVTLEVLQEEKPLTESWKEKFLALPASQRKCRYMINGIVSYKICPNSYECGSCPYDQMMQEIEPKITREKEIPLVAGFRLPEEVYLHEGHTWARPEHAGRVRVGLDDFAQRLIGSIGALSSPNLGQMVKQGEVALSVRRNGNKVSVLSPIDGIISRTNYKTLKNPPIVNLDPYGDGWLFVVEPTKFRGNIKKLHHGEDAKEWMMDEMERLFEMAKTELGMAVSAEGGPAVDNIMAELGEDRWLDFVKKFLRT